MAATATLVGRMAWDDSALTRGLKGSQDKMVAFAKKAGLLAAGAVALGKAKGFFGSSIDAFLTEEAAIKKWEGALRASGNEVVLNTEAMRKLGAEMQRTTVLEDDVVIGMGQMALSMGVTTDRMEETIRGAIGLSRAFGIDETAALKMAAGAMQGKFTMIGRYIPAMKAAKTEAEKMAIAQRAMANAFIVAQSEAESGSGKLTRLKNEWGDFKEQIGEALAPALIGAMHAISKAGIAMGNVFMGVFDSIKVAGMGTLTFLMSMNQVMAELQSMLPGQTGEDGKANVERAKQAIRESKETMAETAKGIGARFGGIGKDGAPLRPGEAGFGVDARTGMPSSAPAKVSAPAVQQAPATFFGQGKGSGGFATPSALDEMNGTLKSIDRTMRMQSSVTWK